MVPHFRSPFSSHEMRIATLGALVALACLVLFGTPAFADDPPYGAGKQDSVVSPLLQQFIEQRESPAAQGASQQDSGEFTRSLSGGLTTKDALAAAAAPSKSGATDDPVRFDSSGNVQVYIHLENTDDDTLQELRDLGADIEIANSDANVVQAWVHTTALDDIAGLDAVEEITAPDYGQTKAGRIVTEGDGIHRADLVRAFSGLSGRGVKVGAISDGVDARGTAQSSNDLPDSIEIDPDNRGSDDEGTALLEIIHDLAPAPSWPSLGRRPPWTWWSPFSGWPTRPSTARAPTSSSTTLATTLNLISRTD